MIIALLVAGIGLLLAGLLTAGFGVQLDLSYGNTLVLAGAVVACTGAIMLALWVVVRELQAMLAQPGAGLRAQSRVETAPQAGAAMALPRSADDGGFLFGRDQPPAEGAAGTEGSAQPPAPPAWLEETARERGRSEAPPEPAEAEPPVKPKRNLLFSSSSRKERERAQARTADPSVADPAPAPAVPPPPAESSEPPPPATFEDAWPKPERARGPDAPPRRGGRAPSTFSEPAAGTPAPDRYAPPGRNEELPPVTVLKSGVVDGMAYSLYSDGSIEAQMPEGMMRFASIDELRTHLDQRS